MIVYFEAGDRRFRIDAEFIESHNDLLTTFYLPLVIVSTPSDLVLHKTRFDGADAATHRIDLVDQFPGFCLHFCGQ